MFGSVVFGIACVIMPLVGWLILNDTWELPLPLLGFTFRPWRLFMLAIGCPSLLCGIALIFLPESPNFVLSLGKQSDTVAILQWMFLKNGGDPKAVPQIGTICEESESIELRERRESLVGHGVGAICSSMWSQTVPLFRGTYLRSTLVASAMQFGNLINANGMYMFFPDTVNRVTHFVEMNPNQAATICQVLVATRALPLNGTAGISSESDGGSCAVVLETETFGYTIGLEILYAVGFAGIASVIKYLGNFPVLGKFLL